ncbi:unnamed protein product, partial [marine sediment metagenome]
MAVGDSSLDGLYSYLGLGRETTFGTGVTATAGLEFLSASPKGLQQSKILEQISRNRVQSKLIKMGKTVEAEVESYFFPSVTATNYLLQNALGGAITSATATGETVGGAAFSHTYAIGDVNAQTNTSLTLNMAKGGATDGKVFEYTGLRVNELSLNAEIDEALKMSAVMIGKDFTTSATDLSAQFTVTTYECLNFISGRVSVENSFASLTSSSFWHVQTMGLVVNNNLKGDAESRRIGSDTLDVLPS